MFEEMQLAGLSDPDYTQTAGSVRLMLSCQLADRELERRLPPGARDVLRVIDRADRPSTGELMAATGRSRPLVLRHLRALEAEGLIEWVGTSSKDPRAFWRRRLE